MKSKTTYSCNQCGKTKDLSPDDTIPVCCEKPMAAAKDLPVCRTSATAEHSRSHDNNEPCDNGRAG